MRERKELKVTPDTGSLMAIISTNRQALTEFVVFWF